MKREDINAFIAKNQKLTRKELAEKCGISLRAVVQREQNLGIKREWRHPAMGVKKVETVQDEPVSRLLLKSKKAWTVEALSNHFGCSVQTIKDAVAAMHASGKNVQVSPGGIELAHDIPKRVATVIDVSGRKLTHHKFGATSDNHLGSKYERLDVLNALFDIWAAQGITTVYNGGNMIDGEARFNKFDIHVYGMQNQVDYFVENWPKRDGITTYYVTGDDHEGWYVQREGVDIGKFIQMSAEKAGRKDLIYLGHMEHDIQFKAAKGVATMRLIHAGGGSAYATSYAPQKIVESYQGGEKPNILLIGHYHKAEYGYPREVHVLQLGCTEDQTPFMRKLKIQAHVGGWTVDFDQDEFGIIHNFRVQFHAFYDKGYYDKAWKYNY